MSYSQYGVTYVKNSGSYSPLKGLWIKKNGTWVAVKTAWTKRSDGVWERVYPTPAGIFTPSASSLSFSTYQNYLSPSNTFFITNTGDWPLVINSAVVSDSASNYVTAVFNSSIYPVTLAPAQSIKISVNVYGNTVGSFSGSIAFTNYTGPLGYANVTIPVSVGVVSDFNGIAVTPDPVSLSYPVLDSPPSATLTVKNNGNGNNLSVTSISSQNGYVSISGITTPKTISGTFSTTNYITNFTGGTTNFIVTAANLNVGTYRDNIIINSNAGNSPTLAIPVTVTVTRPNGLSAFTTPGTYNFVVPTGVHRLNIATIGAGGAGGEAIYNGYHNIAQGGSGGGGGSGAYDLHYVTVTPGETLSLVVGGGGGPGTNGGTSTIRGSFGTISAAGGNFGGTAYDDYSYPSDSGAGGGGDGGGAGD
jgi:hypothetical protein